MLGAGPERAAGVTLHPTTGSPPGVTNQRVAVPSSSLLGRAGHAGRCAGLRPKIAGMRAPKGNASSAWEVPRRPQFPQLVVVTWGGPGSRSVGYRTRSNATVEVRGLPSRLLQEVPASSGQKPGKRP